MCLEVRSRRFAVVSTQKYQIERKVYNMKNKREIDIAQFIYYQITTMNVFPQNHTNRHDRSTCSSPEDILIRVMKRKTSSKPDLDTMQRRSILLYSSFIRKYVNMHLV